MKDRKTLLMIGLGFVVLLWKGPGVVDAVFIAPIRDRETRVELLQKSSAKKTDARAELARATSQLDTWNLRSLPPDRVVATEKYQRWLTELGEKSGFEKVVVAPPQADVRPKDDTYYTVKATVKAQGTLGALCDFLHAFHQSGLLHRVQILKASTARHEGDPVLDLQIDVEALCLVNAPSRTMLFAKTDKPLVPDKPLKARSEYASLTKKNPFIRGYNGPPRPPTPPSRRTSDPPPTSKSSETPKDPPFDAAEHTYLISYFASGDAREVWFYDRSTNERTILSEGNEFQIGDVKGRIVQIADDYVQILVNDEMWELGLGRNLREMTKMPKVKKSEPKSGG